jgi:hypothetical protein
LTHLDGYLQLLVRCASARGGSLAPLDAVKVSQRLHEGDAAWFALGVKGGLLRIGAHAYLYTADPHQTTAWLVEGGAVAWPCWEYLPHAAASSS